MLKVISLSTIRGNRTISLKKEIINLLDINIGNEILFILDKNGIINVRKFKGDVKLETGEKYISSAYVTQPGISIVVTITGDVRRFVNADIGDTIIWVLDNDGNIIIRNTVILDECSTNIFNKGITALIIGLSTLNRQTKIAAIPKEIRDILGLNEGDKVMISLDEYGNTTISKEIRENLLQESIVIGRQDFDIYLNNTVVDILHIVDKILWFFDEEGIIIIKNDLLPDNCIRN